jgi:Uma2 family endonuclease
VTAEQLFQMCEEERYELVRGVLVPMSPPPGFRHGAVAANVNLIVGRFAKEQKLGWITGAETGFRISRDPDTVRAPDFAFVARGRVTHEMDLTRYLDLAPDLVVEVVSPSDSASDVNEKVLDYLEAGARLVWICYPNSRSIEVHRPGGDSRILSAGDEISGENVLPGFACPVASFFATPDDA